MSTNPTRSAATLAEPLKQAMAWKRVEREHGDYTLFAPELPEVIARLRQNPATTAAIAEALHSTAPKDHKVGGEPLLNGRCPGAVWHSGRARDIADTLLGRADQ